MIQIVRIGQWAETVDPQSEFLELVAVIFAPVLEPVVGGERHGNAHNGQKEDEQGEIARRCALFHHIYFTKALLTLTKLVTQNKTGRGENGRKRASATHNK